MTMRSLTVLLLLWCLATVPAAAQQVSLQYAATAYGVLPFGRAQVQVQIEDGEYQSTASLETRGLAALVARASLSARSVGRWSAAGAGPRRYALDHRFRGRRLSSIEWNGEGVIQTAEPAFDDPGNPAPTEAQRRAGRDPLAALLTMSAFAHAEQCAGTVRVYDGLYVYDLSLSPLGEGVVEQGEADWRVVKCTLRQQRIAGYRRPEDLAKRMAPGEIWFAVDTGLPFAVPVRVTTHLSLGPATIRLTGFSRS